MQNPRLAGRYAKSLLDLATERGQVEVVYKDMQYVQAVCAASKEFITVLKSPVFNSDKKVGIINAVLGNNISDLTRAFITLLVTKGREMNFAEMADAFIDQYNTVKGIHKVKLTTATEVSESVKEAIVSKVKQEAGFDSVELETKVDEKLIGGFVLEFDNKLVDASISKDLNEIRKEFSHNVYVQSIR
ncbi:MAG: atpH [Chitinophagaceae bacterium]|nr:atpH [Chitinophagaceae bacterium]